MRRSFVLKLALVIAAHIAAQAIWPSASRAQSLDVLRNDIRNGPPSSPVAPSTPEKNDSSLCSSSGSSCDDDGGLGEMELEVIGGVITSPYWIPYNVLGDDFSNTRHFMRYPYWHDKPGILFPQDGTEGPNRPWVGEASFEYANDFDDLSRYGAHMLISTASRVDVEFNWNQLGQDTIAGRDHVFLGDFDVLFRFAQSERVQFRSGLGANWFDDHHGTAAGFNFRYGVDYYPASPWVLTAVMDLGELGKAGLVHLRTTAGIDWKRWELYTGYDYRKIGRFDFGGPIAGVEMRF